MHLEVRQAIHRKAVAEFVDRQGVDEFCLQLAGAGLLHSGEVRVPRSRSAVEQVIAGLHERRWWGDEIMADWLTDALAGRDDAEALPIDIESLAQTLESGSLFEGELRIYVDLRTGEQIAGGLERAEINEEDMDYVRLPTHRFRGESWRDREMFVAWVEDPRLADRLLDALQGRGAYRRFRAILEDYPALMSRFWDFANDRQYGRAVQWLHEEDLRLAVGGLKVL